MFLNTKTVARVKIKERIFADDEFLDPYYK